MPPLLPMPARRATLRAFGAVTAAGIILSGAVIAAVTASAAPFWIAAALGAVLLGLAVLAPARLRPACAAWNRLTRVHARIARLLVLRLMHLTVLAARRHVRSPLVLEAAEAPASLWTLRSPQVTATDPRPAPVRGWLGRWAHHAAEVQPWALPLLPFLLMLRWLGRDEHARQPHAIYTLY